MKASNTNREIEMNGENASTACLQAPAGGAVSMVNAEFYAGGQFMPASEDARLRESARRAAKKIARHCAAPSEVVVSRPAFSVSHDRIVWMRFGDRSMKKAMRASREQCLCYAATLATELRECGLDVTLTSID